MKYITLLFLIVFLQGCGEGYTRPKWKIKCIDGVEYVIGILGHQGYMSGHFKPDGSLYTCNGDLDVEDVK